MMKPMSKQHRMWMVVLTLMMTLLLGAALTGCGTAMETFEEVLDSEEVLREENVSPEDTLLNQDGFYTSKEEVALYLHLYRELPLNFITKAEAAALGWEASKGNLWDVTDQKSIGGDGFGNREGLLPVRNGRHYYECDINYQGGYRGAERIVYSNDGLVYYTPDHYESFEFLYGEE